MNIKNYEAVVAELAEMLMQFAKEEKPYSTGVYLDYDEETQTAELETAAEFDTSPWANDDNCHYRIYTDEPHYCDMWDWYQSIEELAEYAEISEEQLVSEVREYFEEDEDFSPDYHDVKEYLENSKKCAEYIEKLTAAYNENLDDIIEEQRADYEREAAEIIDNFIEKQNYEEQRYQDMLQ